MITHLMQPKDIAHEYWQDLDRATFWMNKKSGGINGRARTFNNMIYQLYAGAQEKRSEIFFYDSPKTGNKWMMWDAVRMGKNGMVPESYRVCYQLTEQYMCIMAPTTLVMQEGEPMNGITIYTPHLFQRMHERLGVDMTDRLKVIRNFCENLVNGMMDHREPRKGEKNEQMVCRLPGSWLRGHFVRVGSGYVTIYRTFYTDATLTIKQRKELKSFRKMADKIRDSGDFEAYVKEKKKEIYDSNNY